MEIKSRENENRLYSINDDLEYSHVHSHNQTEDEYRNSNDVNNKHCTQTDDDDDAHDVDLLLHEIESVLDRALEVKSIRARDLDGTKQEQNRLVHAMVHSKLNSLPRHPSKVHATLLQEREDRLVADRKRRKRQCLVRAELRRLKQCLSDRKQEVTWLRDECKRVKDELKEQAKKHKLESESYSRRLTSATVELAKTKSIHEVNVAQLRRAFSKREAELLDKVAQMAQELQICRSNALERTLELLDNE